MVLVTGCKGWACLGTGDEERVVWLVKMTKAMLVLTRGWRCVHLKRFC